MAKILVVEDHADSADVLIIALKKAGHSVLHALDGRRALDDLIDLPIDLIVLDLRMAGFDGIAFLRVLRSYLRWQALPVIVVSAATDVEMERAEQFGVAHVFRKANFQVDTFLTAVQDALQPRDPHHGLDDSHGRPRY